MMSHDEAFSKFLSMYVFKCIYVCVSLCVCVCVHTCVSVCFCILSVFLCVLRIGLAAANEVHPSSSTLIATDTCQQLFSNIFVSSAQNAEKEYLFSFCDTPVIITFLMR